MREPALAWDAVVLTVGAHAVALAPNASEPSSENRSWTLARRSRGRGTRSNSGEVERVQGRRRREVVVAEDRGGDVEEVVVAEVEGGVVAMFAFAGIGVLPTS